MRIIKAKRSPKKNPRITPLFLHLTRACSPARADVRRTFGDGDVWLEDVNFYDARTSWLSEKHSWLIRAILKHDAMEEHYRRVQDARVRLDQYIEAATKQYARGEGYRVPDYYNEFARVKVAMLRDIIVEYYNGPKPEQFLTPTFLETSRTGKISIQLRRVYVRADGYTKDGRYFGVGQKVWEFENVSNYIDWFRADDLASARHRAAELALQGHLPVMSAAEFEVLRKSIRWV